MKTFENRLYAVVDASRKPSAKGDFWALKIRNKEELIDAKIWHPHSQVFTTITSDSVIMIYKGEYTEYQGNTYINVQEATTVDPSTLSQEEICTLIPVAKFDIESKFMEMRAFVSKFVKEEKWKKFAFSILDNSEIANLYKTTIGGVSVHHAYVGGLLEHTYACMRNIVALQNANNYVMNVDLAIVGALVHDIGKSKEYKSGISFGVSLEGSLIGHIVIGIEMIAPYLEKSDLDENDKSLLRHLIVSHHGLLEYGSPKIPITIEAEVMHIVDLLDSRLNTASMAIEKVENVMDFTESIRSRGYIKYLKTV